MVARETLVTLWTRPPGTHFSRSPVAEQAERVARIYYAYRASGMSERWGVFTFYGTYAFRFLDEPPWTGLFRECEAERARLLHENVTPCSCCETRAISKPGAFEVCHVCGWEDDPSQSANPAREGGANVMSLNAARAAWKANPMPLTRR